MRRLERYFLARAPWELFLLLVIAPAIARVLSGIPLTPGPEDPPGPEWYQMFMVAWLAMLSLWFWSIGISLNRRVRSDIRPGALMFRLAVAYPVLYTLAISVVYGNEVDLEPPPAEVAAIALSSLLALACVGYTIRYVAKNLWLAEQQRDVRFRNYGGTLFLLFFYPVALWFVQPRVQRVCPEGVASG